MWQLTEWWPKLVLAGFIVYVAAQTANHNIVIPGTSLYPCMNGAAATLHGSYESVRPNVVAFPSSQRRDAVGMFEPLQQ